MKKLVILSSVILLTFSMVGCQNNQSTSTEKSEVNNTIPYPEGYDTKSSGASSYANSGDHKDSPYFSNIDVYNLKSTDTLTVLPKFKTYQQTKEYTCGPATALMVLEHFGENNYDELEISEMMNTHKDLDGDSEAKDGFANEKGEFGTSTDRMVSFFEQIGWDVTSSLTEGKLEGGYTFDDPMKFKDFVIKNLKENTPVMVEWIDWGGHWLNIIGYDTMGTEEFGDDVLILADPYDTSDHSQDGYQIYPAERFYYMWLDKNILPEDQGVQQWVVAKPKK